MYDYVKGIFTFKNATTKGCFATVEAGGIGYSFEVMERDYNILPNINSELKMYLVLLHREDKMSLCGFVKREDRDIFNILTSVSGVGSKMALGLLNAFEISELVGFVLDGNYKALMKAKGVGQKLAQKIILELKDKLTNFEGNISLKSSGDKNSYSSSENARDAQMVLLSLGYNDDEISLALTKAFDKLEQNASAEEILKEGLKVLSISG